MSTGQFGIRAIAVVVGGVAPQGDADRGDGLGRDLVRLRTSRWEQRGDRVLLRDVKYDIRADVDDPIRMAVESTSLAPIIAVIFGQSGLHVGATLEGVKYTRIIP